MARHCPFRRRLGRLFYRIAKKLGGLPEQSALHRFETPQHQRKSDRSNWESIYIQPGPPVLAVTSETARILATLSAPHDVLLEAGSGYATVSAEMAILGRQPYLLDFSEVILRNAVTMFAASSLPPPVTLVANLLEAIPLANKSVDIAWNGGVLEHWGDSQVVGVLREMARISRKRVVTLVPYAGCVLYRLGKEYAEQSGTWPYGVEKPRQSMCDAFSAAGLLEVRERVVCHEGASSFLRYFGCPELTSLVLGGPVFPTQTRYATTRGISS